MSQEHAMEAAQLHHEFDGQGDYKGPSTDLVGAPLKDEKEIYDSDEASGHAGPTPDGGEPTEEERATLRRKGEWLPAAAWLVALVELCERFTYYGASGLFANYILLPYRTPKPGETIISNGALGLTTQAVNGLTTFFQFWAYVTPILGAIIADQYLGKYKTILIFCSVYIAGLIILVATSVPSSLQAGAGEGGFIAALIVIGLGTGGIKSNVAPLIADQYTRRKMAIQTLPKTGERIIIDPAITIQRIYMIFYGCINLGSLSLIATPYMEKYIGFWSAYTMCLAMFFVGFAVLVFGRKFYVIRPPQGSVITNAFRAIGQMIKARNMDAPKPSVQAAHGQTPTTRWDDQFIDELKRALVACRVFVLYPIFWVAYNQFSGNFVVQAEEMRGHGIPNDFMQNFDPIAIIVAIPILDRLVYPALQKRKIQLRPITRITIGFWIAALAMTYASILQHFIYTTGPCYDDPLSGCKGSVVLSTNPTVYQPGNDIHIAIQTPAYMLIGLSEVFISVTGLEYAYTKAPPSMKSFVQSLYLFTNAFGSALGETLSSVATDPKYVWFYAGIAIACAITGTVFWFLFNHLNAVEEELNQIDKNDPFKSQRNMSVNAQQDVHGNAGHDIHVRTGDEENATEPGDRKL